MSLKIFFLHSSVSLPINNRIYSHSPTTTKPSPSLCLWWLTSGSPRTWESWGGTITSSVQVAVPLTPIAVSLQGISGSSAQLSFGLLKMSTLIISCYLAYPSKDLIMSGCWGTQHLGLGAPAVSLWPRPALGLLGVLGSVGNKSAVSLCASFCPNKSCSFLDA